MEQVVNIINDPAFAASVVAIVLSPAGVSMLSEVAKKILKAESKWFRLGIVGMLSLAVSTGLYVYYGYQANPYAFLGISTATLISISRIWYWALIKGASAKFSQFTQNAALGKSLSQPTEAGQEFAS